MPGMGMGSTRVFGHTGSGVIVVGLRRQPARDLYHWLVTGPWSRLLALYAIVYFATQGLFGLARLLAAAGPPQGGGLVAALVAALEAPPDPGPPLSARAIATAAIEGVHGFVHWIELVIGASIVIAKFTLVRARVLFSEVAVVGPHGGGTALMFRMANERSSHIVDAKVSVMLVRNELQDGEVVRRAHDLALLRDGSALFSHAWTAIHPIDRASPLLGESAGSLEGNDGEIIVNISGVDEGLARAVHARHVYPASRIRWNARFRDVVRLREDGKRVIDYRKFHKTAPVEEEPARADRTPTARRAR
jgi:inward rectifier potassium channel